MSLIEILVVMTIIAMLAAASLAVLGRTGESARREQTVALIRELHSLVNARYNEMMQSFSEQEGKKSRTTDWLNIAYNARNDPTTSVLSPALAEVVIKADRYRGALPQRVADLYGPDGLPAGTDNSPLLLRWTSGTPVWNNTPINLSNHKPETESSELLYLALTVGSSTGAGQEVLGAIHPRHIQDTDGDGFPEFVDGWGRPLRFYNAPTGLIRPRGWIAPYAAPTPAQFAFAESLISGLPGIPTGTPATSGYYAQSFNQDPLDSRGVIRSTLPAFQTGFEALYRTRDTWFKPLIVSCGPDEVLGLGEPSATGSVRLAGYDMNGDGDTIDPPDVEAADAATDNVTNLQRAGG